MGWWVFGFVRATVLLLRQIFFGRLLFWWNGCINTDLSRFRGKKCVVTGATSGIGAEMARLLYENHAHVILAVRNTDLGRRLATEWESACVKGSPKGSWEVAHIDLASLQSVRDFASEIRTRHDSIDVLVNNAGILDLSWQSAVYTTDGYEQHIAINYLGPFLLTGLLLPMLQKSVAPTIINVASCCHFFPNSLFPLPSFIKSKQGDNHSTLISSAEPRYHTFSYSHSKLMLVCFTQSLQQRLAKQQHQPTAVVVSADPGVVATNISRGLHSIIATLRSAVLGAVMLSPKMGALCVLSSVCGQTKTNSGYFEFGKKLRPNAATNQHGGDGEALWRWSCEVVGLPRD